MTDSLHLDFETRSELDISAVGLHNYATHPSTEVLMMAWAVNSGRIRLWEPHKGERIPAEVREALDDPFVDKCAWNAPFERAISKFVLKLDIPIEEWHDPSITARSLSLPGSLADVGEILGLGNEFAKMEEGEDLIKVFCEPRETGGKPGLFGTTATVWHDWTTHPKEWETFGKYCCRDVKAEREIDRKIGKFAPPPIERRNWILDQRINERGMPVDMELVAGAAKIAAREQALLSERLHKLTGLENPNSNPQFLEWARAHGYPFNALGKALVKRALDGEGDIPFELREALLWRAQASKASVHKLEAIRLNVAPDGRLRHQYVFGGASKTQRWAGTGAQLQNLPRPSKEIDARLEEAVALLRAGDHAPLAAVFDNPLDVVTSCIRPMFRAPEGKKLVVSDLNAIENRVLGWIARCPGILRVFEQQLDPYKDFATELYGVPYDAVTKEQRNNSKPAVLGCFGKDTLVRTGRGWQKIACVRSDDLLWDGVEWVSHDGLVDQGIKHTINLFGVVVTPDHQVMVEEGTWREAWEIVQNTQLASKAIASASGLSNEVRGTTASFTTFASARDAERKSLSKSSQTKTSAKARTYDILNAGPRNRFMVLTEAGALIVHNCGYRLGGGEEKINEDGDSVKSGLMGYAAALGVTLTQDEANHAVQVFRKKFQEVVAMWKDIEEAAVHAVRHPGQTVPVGQVSFFCHSNRLLQMILPVGRCINYIDPRVHDREVYWKEKTFTKPSLSYKGKDQVTRQWIEIDNHGGGLVENACQAISRDILAHGMHLADQKGFEVVGHVHDELVTLVPLDSPLTVHDLEECMAKVPTWVSAGEGLVWRKGSNAACHWPELPLAAEGYEDSYYRKG
jgi:hypothetical protein